MDNCRFAGVYARNIIISPFSSMYVIINHFPHMGQSMPRDILYANPLKTANKRFAVCQHCKFRNALTGIYVQPLSMRRTLQIWLRSQLNKWNMGRLFLRIRQRLWPHWWEARKWLRKRVRKLLILLCSSRIHSSKFRNALTGIYVQPLSILLPDGSALARKRQIPEP